MNELSGFEYFKRSLTEHYADFSGRARRSEYWYFILFSLLITIPFYVVMVIGGVMESGVVTGIGGLVYGIAALGLIIPQLAVAVRRLHDTGRSGWWYLIALVPLIGSIVLLVFFVSDSEPGTNKWGPNPKTGAALASDPINHIEP